MSGTQELTVTAGHPGPWFARGGEEHSRERLVDSVAGMLLLRTAVEVPAGEDPPASLVMRCGLLEDWLVETVARRGPVAEPAFEEWLGQGPMPAGLSAAAVERRRSAAGALRHQFSSLRLDGDGGSEPAIGGPPRGLPCPGALLYPSLAAACHRWRPVAVCRSFAAFSSLDRGAERGVAGLMAALHAQAVAERPFRAGVGAWLMNTAGRLFEDVRRSAAEGQEETEGAEAPWSETARLDRLEEVLYTVSSELAGRGPGEVGVGMDAETEAAEALAARVSARLGSGDGASGGAVLALSHLAIALELAGGSLPTALRLLRGEAPSRRAARSLAASLAGAWYGRCALEDDFGPELDRAADLLWSSFRLEPEAHGALCWELSFLLDTAARAPAPSAGRSS